MARVHDYLRAFTGHVAVLLSVELCSLTLQRDDTSIPALIGVSLFGDGAAAVVATGADRAPVGPGAYRGPRILASRSLLLPATADMMGWDVSSNGLGLVLSKDVPKMVDVYLGEEVDRFLVRIRVVHREHLDVDLPSRWSQGARFDRECDRAAAGSACKQQKLDAGERQHVFRVGA